MSVVLLCHLPENIWGLENSRVGRLWCRCEWLRLLDILVRCSPRTSTNVPLQGRTSPVGTEPQARGIFAKLWGLFAASHLTAPSQESTCVNCVDC